MSNSGRPPAEPGVYSGLLWEGMDEKGIVRPSLSPQEMAEITAYLFSISYFDESGNADSGKTLFVKKQCIVCHNKEAKRLDLSRLRGQISPIFMAQTLWNHGSEMLERMRNKNIPWEKFYYNDMSDLMEYLNGGML